VLYHFWNDVLGLFPALDRVSPLVQVGHMAVPAFFMLSGFVLAYNYADQFRHLRRDQVIRFLCLRLARVYPVHLVTLLVVLIMVVVSSRVGYQLTDDGYTVRDFVLNLSLMQTWVPDFTLNWNYPSWSISSEWFAYLLFPLAIAGSSRHLTTTLRATFVVVASLAGAVAVMNWWRPWPFYELILVVPTFFSGAAVYFVLRGHIDAGRSRLWRWVSEWMVSAAVVSIFVFSPRIVVASLLACFLGLITVLAWLGTNCTKMWAARPAIYLGEVSYSLYMTHTIAQKVVYRLLPASRFEAAELLTKLGVLAVYALTITFLCLGTYYCVEWPCRIFFKKLTRRTAGSSQLLQPTRPAAPGTGTSPRIL
jgi:peptidoglycan/LPS O-acetylase OafA/YrhL